MGIETILAVGSIAASAGGAAMSLAGGSAASDAALQKGRAAQQSANFNATAEEQQAANERDVAGAQSQDFLRKGSDTVETAVADQAGSGVTMEGSPLMVDENTVRQVALGAARIREGGDLRAGRLEQDAKLKRMEGSNSVTASYLDSTTSLLSGATGALNSGASALSTGAKFANPNFGKALA